MKFAKTIEEDLARRDFTINAIALNIDVNKVIDPYGAGRFEEEDGENSWGPR